MLKELFSVVINRHSAMVVQLLCLLTLFVIGLLALAFFPGNEGVKLWVQNGVAIIAIIAIIRGVQDEKNAEKKPEDPAKREP